MNSTFPMIFLKLSEPSVSKLGSKPIFMLAFQLQKWSRLLSSSLHDAQFFRYSPPVGISRTYSISAFAPALCFYATRKKNHESLRKNGYYTEKKVEIVEVFSELVK